VRRPSTMLASATAAALAALAVTVAVPAIGDEGPSDVDDLAACLREHGLEGAPDGAGLKRWLGERLERGDREALRAVDECAPIRIEGPPPPELRELRTCLVEHGAQIDGTDPAAVKRWIGEHADDPAARDALKACHVAAPADKPAIACEGVGAPPPGAPEVKPAPATEAAPRDL
jgi:hypothetical protein